MFLKDKISFDLKKGVLTLLLVFLFFYFSNWDRLALILTSKPVAYITNLDGFKAGAQPIIAYNWLAIIISLLLSLIVAYALSVILFNTIFKKGIKNFLVYSKTKLFITFGLIVFSSILGLVTIELHQYALRPLSNFFNVAELFEPILIHQFGGAISFILYSLLWAFQMYFYSCLISYIKDAYQLSNKK